MKNIHLIIYSCILLLVDSGCGKNGTDCFMSTGEISREERTASPFDSIDVGDNVSLFLIQDTVDKVVVEAGKNLLHGITTNVNNKQLIIRNLNTCNWVRSYDKPINVYVSFRNFWKIAYNSSGDIATMNTISLDSLLVEIWGGCGEVSLDVNLNQGYFYLKLGTADLILSGKCGVASLYTGDFGLLDARELNAGYAFITSRSSNNCYVKASEEVNATIESIGNIYYTGNPKAVITTIHGSGSVIPF
jgi:hypothetical protein